MAGGVRRPERRSSGVRSASSGRIRGDNGGGPNRAAADLGGAAASGGGDPQAHRHHPRRWLAPAQHRVQHGVLDGRGSDAQVRSPDVVSQRGGHRGSGLFSDGALGATRRVHRDGVETPVQHGECRARVRGPVRSRDAVDAVREHHRGVHLRRGSEHPHLPRWLSRR